MESWLSGWVNLGDLPIRAERGGRTLRPRKPTVRVKRGELAEWSKAPHC